MPWDDLFFILSYLINAWSKTKGWTLLWISSGTLIIFMNSFIQFTFFFQTVCPLHILTSEPRRWLEALQLLLPGVFQVLSQHDVLVPVVILFVWVVVVCLLATHSLSVLQQLYLVVRQQAFLLLHLKSSHSVSPIKPQDLFLRTMEIIAVCRLMFVREQIDSDLPHYPL